MPHADGAGMQDEIELVAGVVRVFETEVTVCKTERHAMPVGQTASRVTTACVAQTRTPYSYTADQTAFSNEIRHNQSHGQYPTTTVERVPVASPEPCSYPVAAG